MKYLIWRPDYSETIDDAADFENHHEDIEFVGEAYAEYYWSNRDGWDASWPIEFFIADENKNYLGKVSVDVRHDPSFHGRLVTND